ncbi:MAG: hypothetical protein IJS22_07400 [Lachnospiraceae bacterium]|nr:hypothetical protein [Lachnospiraceae bacterium]
MKKLLTLTIALLLLLAAGCGEDPDATNPAPYDDGPAAVTSSSAESKSAGDETPVTDGSPAVSGSAAPAGWEIYEKARNATDALDNREYQTMVYTRIVSGGDSQAQSLNLLVKYIGAHSSAPQISATGSVKAKDRIIELEMYYRDSVLYSSSGDSRSKQETYFEAAASEIDVLRVFRKELLPEYITDISVEDSVDGTRQISMRFHGMINALDTVGSGEIVVSSSGYITSEGYTFNTQSQGQTVSQSVEVTLTGYGDALAPIVFPDLSGY